MLVDWLTCGAFMASNQEKILEGFLGSDFLLLLKKTCSSLSWMLFSINVAQNKATTKVGRLEMECVCAQPQTSERGRTRANHQGSGLGPRTSGPHPCTHFIEIFLVVPVHIILIHIPGGHILHIFI